MSSAQFNSFVSAGQPVGEVVGVDRFLVTVRGLQPVNARSLVLFDDDSRGYVQRIAEDSVVIFHMGAVPPLIGSIVVVQYDQLVCNVGEQYIGRIIAPDGRPLDGKGPIAPEASWPIFHVAPKIHERELLSDLLESGVTLIDSLFPIVRGQRMAIIGDSKSGKTSLAVQLAINQQGTDSVTVYVLIAKRQADIDDLITRLTANDTLKNTIVVVSTIFDSLVMSFLAPYVACAMGEFLWQDKNRDVIIIYDDLTNHAQAYREMALIGGVSPGRDSYPGDVFYTHSSLLERAGKLNRNHKTMTAIPIVLAAGGGVTAYLPTNVISITDGQWILDKEIFRDGLRPAINTGLSVTRVGGRGHTQEQKELVRRSLRAVAAYAQALEYSRFGSAVSAVTLNDLKVGALLRAIFNQEPNESYPIVAQQLMLDVVLNLTEAQTIDVAIMRSTLSGLLATIHTSDGYASAKSALLALITQTAEVTS
jgi:F-type H+-transporting ATPase subunit alpha